MSKVLILHGNQDNVFPLTAAERVLSIFRTNGVPTDLKILTGQAHNLEPNRAVVFRGIGEYCLTQLKGPGALARYHSSASWRAGVQSLWVYWVPAMVWLAACSLANQCWRLRTQRDSKLKRWEILLRGLVAILAALAIGLTAFHLIVPQFQVGGRTLALAREYLIQPKQEQDFDSVAAHPIWTGQCVRTLLTHVELAHYNRELVNWKLDDAVFREFVLSPRIDPVLDGETNWRRPLWESFYPRVRREQSLEVAAEIVVRHLRERLTIADGKDLPVGIESAWLRQVTNAKGFERVYVAALRSSGIPARLDSQGRTEFCAETGWKPAPRPLMESLLR